MAPSVLAAPDKFRGTLSANQAASAIEEGARRAGWACDRAPLSDGGEGFLEVLSGTGSLRVARVDGPLGGPVDAEWALVRDPEQPALVTALIESARAIGLTLAGGAEGNDPVRASTAGVGQLVLAATKAGAKRAVVATGGSATTDGGLGAVEALAPGGRPPDIELIVACDVQTKFVDAAAIFSPQKGAAPAQVELLKRRLERVAQLYGERFGVDVRDLPGSGSAGGLAGGLAALGAKLVPGFELVAERLSLADRIASADLVVTGEGRIDEQSFEGKTVGGVIDLAGRAGVPVLVIAGCGAREVTWPYVDLTSRFGATEALANTAALVSEVVQSELARMSAG